MARIYDFEYEFDGEKVDRWNTKTERLTQLPGKFADEFTALNRARKDWTRLRNLHPNAQAVWHYGDGKREYM